MSNKFFEVIYINNLKVLDAHLIIFVPVLCWLGVYSMVKWEEWHTSADSLCNHAACYCSFSAFFLLQQLHISVTRATRCLQQFPLIWKDYAPTMSRHSLLNIWHSKYKTWTAEVNRNRISPLLTNSFVSVWVTPPISALLFAVLSILVTFRIALQLLEFASSVMCFYMLLLTMICFSKIYILVKFIELNYWNYFDSQHFICSRKMMNIYKLLLIVFCY